MRHLRGVRYIIAIVFVCRVRKIQGVGKGGLSLRGVAFMTVLVVLTALALLESTFKLPSFCLTYKIQRNEATVAVPTVSAVMAVPVRQLPRLNSTPLFRDPEKSHVAGGGAP